MLRAVKDPIGYIFGYFFMIFLTFGILVDMTPTSIDFLTALIIYDAIGNIFERFK